MVELSCYDCIHCGACSDAGDGGFSCLKEDVSKCKHFKNKADFVEVVRCVNCAFYDIEEYNCREFDCNMPCDGYCSKGTQKERGGEK